MTVKIAIGSDHAGFEIKEKIKDILFQKGYQVEDMGTKELDSCDYPDYALLVAESVANQKVDRGILVCGTGIGMSIAANKVPGVRAGLCWNEETTKLSRSHNNTNVLCLGARTTPQNLLESMVIIWLETKYEDNAGRHERRIEKIRSLEKKYS